MQGAVSIQGFAAAAGIGEPESRAALERLATAGIGARAAGGRDEYEFAGGDRLRAAVLAVREGAAGVDEVSEHIGWRDFEGLAAEILESRGFDAARNLRIGGGRGRKRAEIDVAATKGGDGPASRLQALAAV